MVQNLVLSFLLFYLFNHLFIYLFIDVYMNFFFLEEGGVRESTNVQRAAGQNSKLGHGTVGGEGEDFFPPGVFMVEGARGSVV